MPVVHKVVVVFAKSVDQVLLKALAFGPRSALLQGPVCPHSLFMNMACVHPAAAAAPAAAAGPAGPLDCGRRVSVDVGLHQMQTRAECRAGPSASLAEAALHTPR